MARKTKTDGSRTEIAGTETMPAPRPTVDVMSSLFAPADFQLPQGTEINSLSPMVSPIDFPAGRRLVGRLTKLFETNPTKEKKGVGIEIVPDGRPVGIALPAVTTIARALKIDAEKGANATCPYIGRYVVIEKLEKKIPSKRGKDAWNFIVAILPADFIMQTLPAEAST